MFSNQCAIMCLWTTAAQDAWSELFVILETFEKRSWHQLQLRSCASYLPVWCMDKNIWPVFQLNLWADDKLFILRSIPFSVCLYDMTVLVCDLTSTWTSMLLSSIFFWGALTQTDDNPCVSRSLRWNHINSNLSGLTEIRSWQACNANQIEDQMNMAQMKKRSDPMCFCCCSCSHWFDVYV